MSTSRMPFLVFKVWLDDATLGFLSDGQCAEVGGDVLVDKVIERVDSMSVYA
jgi:hypothetical protein